MDQHIRYRKAPPSEDHAEEISSGRMASSSSTASRNIGPMNIGGSAPPPPMSNRNIVYRNQAYVHSPKPTGSEPFVNPTFPAQMADNVSPKPPTLNIFGNSVTVDHGPQKHGIQSYLDGGAGTSSLNSQVHVSRVPSMNSYHSSQMSSPYSVPSPNTSWKPQMAYDPGSYNSQHIGFGVQQPDFQNAMPQFGRNGSNSQLGFFQQLKQIGQLFIPSEQVEDDLIDPPLLEELGIDVNDIISHIKCVLFFKSFHNGELRYADFTGSILILLLLALSLLVSCNLNFSLLYVIEVFGTWFMYLLLNLTSQNVYIEMSKTAIILGYSLLPICLVPFLWIVSRFARPLAYVFIYMCVGWSASTASRLLTHELNMENRKYLVVYPTFLYYLFFAQVAIS